MCLPQMGSKLRFRYATCLIICPLIFKSPIPTPLRVWRLSRAGAPSLQEGCQEAAEKLLMMGSPWWGPPASPPPRCPSTHPPQPVLRDHLASPGCPTAGRRLFGTPFGRWHSVTSKALVSSWPWILQGHLHFHFSWQPLCSRLSCLPKKSLPP